MLLTESLNQGQKCCPLLQRDGVQPVRTIEKHPANPAQENTLCICNLCALALPTWTLGKAYGHFCFYWMLLILLLSGIKHHFHLLWILLFLSSIQYYFCLYYIRKKETYIEIEQLCIHLPFRKRTSTSLQKPPVDAGGSNTLLSSLHFRQAFSRFQAPVLLCLR